MTSVHQIGAGTPSEGRRRQALRRSRIDDRHRHRAGEAEREPAQHAQHAERDEEGGDAQLGDEQAVDRADDGAEQQHQPAPRPSPARRGRAASPRPWRRSSTCEPTDRSISPQTMTKVMPTAMIVTTAVIRPTAPAVAKAGEVRREEHEEER